MADGQIECIEFTFENKIKNKKFRNIFPDVKVTVIIIIINVAISEHGRLMFSRWPKLGRRAVPSQLSIPVIEKIKFTHTHTVLKMINWRFTTL